MIDTHSHLLPGVDHGCPDLETSLLMATEAASSGVDTVVCTPHLLEYSQADIAHVREVIDEVRAAVRARGIDLTLLLGFEADLSVAATARPEALEELVVEGSAGVIVLETPYIGWPVFLEETIFRLSTAGFVPVLAHPERNERVQESPELLAKCLKAGAVAQATAGSVGGEFGKASEQAFFRLLSEGLIGLLASDAHAHRREWWTMGPMLASLSGMFGEEDVAVLTERNPRRLLAGEKLLPVIPAKTGRSWGRTRRIWPR